MLIGDGDGTNHDCRVSGSSRIIIFRPVQSKTEPTLKIIM
jgi:hypothetical protein